ncbi:hypothetical protein D3C71_199670 [compost metagenome]
MPRHQAAHFGVQFFLAHQLETEDGRFLFLADEDIDIARQLVDVRAADGGQLEWHGGLVLRPLLPWHCGRRGRKRDGLGVAVEMRGRLRAALAFFRGRDGHDAAVINQALAGQHQQVDARDQHAQAHFQFQLVRVAAVVPRHGGHALPLGAVRIAPVHVQVELGRGRRIRLVAPRLLDGRWWRRAGRHGRGRHSRCWRRDDRGSHGGRLGRGRSFRHVAGGRSQLRRFARRQFRRWRRRCRQAGLGQGLQLRRRRRRRHRHGFGWLGDQRHADHLRMILPQRHHAGTRGEPFQRHVVQCADDRDKNDGAAARW